MEPVVEIHRNFLLGGYRLEYRNHLELHSGALSSLTDTYFSSIFPDVVATNGRSELLDFKGRDIHDLLDSTLPKPTKDELFLLGGRIAVGAKKSGFEWEDFSVTGVSVFRRFEGAHHIVYGCEIERSGALPSWIPVRLLGRVAPLEPTLFRFGLEHFRSSIFSASLGYAPSVTESIIVDACERHLTLKLQIESRDKDPQIIFDKVPVLAQCMRIVGAAAGVDELGTYLSSVRRA